MKTLKRRRNEGKTDYTARLALLSSGKPRIVVRKTNRYFIVQVISSEGAQDKVIFGITSKVLLSMGWPKESEGSLKSLPAAYLTGRVIGEQAKSKIKSAIFDMGMHRNVHKSRIYAVLKGLIDSGLSVSHGTEALPTLERLKAYPKLGKLIDSVKVGK